MLRIIKLQNFIMSNELLRTNFNEYKNFVPSKQSRYDPKYDLQNLLLADYDCNNCYEKGDKKEETLADTVAKESVDLPLDDEEKPIDILLMPALYGDEEKVKIKGLKILTTNKHLTRPQILLAYIKAGKNSNQKNEIRPCIYFEFIINPMKWNYHKLQ